MNKILPFFLLLAINSKAEIQLSLLTTTPGDEPHTLFGHSALRIVDEENNFDRLYNFGLFDFNASFFPIKFLGGDLKYWLGRQTIEGFKDINNKEKRLIKEQVLDLPENTEEAIFNALKNRHTPENKFYRYSFIHKNCATEIRDLLYKYDVLKTDKKLDKSYRQLITEYTSNHRWFRFGINIIMGCSVDKKATFKGAMFLPDYLEQAVAKKEGLVIENKVLNNPEKKDYNRFLIILFSPLLVFSSLFVLSLFWSPRWFRIVFYSVFGILGMFLLALWGYTKHPELTNNWNVLWANPLFLLLIPKSKQLSLTSIKVLIPIAGLILTVVFWLFSIQQFDWALIPIIAMTIWFLWKELKSNKLISQERKN